MATVTLEVKGGAQMERILSAMESKLGSGALVRVGFLEGATYPAKGKRGKTVSVAQVAFWNEFGTMRKLSDGIRRVQHVPPRPFFRSMIREKSPGWGRSMARIIKQQDYNAEKVLALMGLGIQSQLHNSINMWPPDNAPSTVKAKGFNHGLIHTAWMLRSVDFQVLLGSARP